MLLIQSLSYQYKKSDGFALRDLSLHVAPGALFGLLGPNGAGKTTLLSMLSGGLPHPQGSIQLAGRNINLASHNDVSLVPQEYAFYENLTIQENLQFFARIQSATTNSVDAAVATTGLEDKLGYRASQLSGGLKRRLNLAIGLLSRPLLLLLDEPTVGIDPHSRRFLLQAIKAINAEGTTVVYTSHYMEEVEYLCDYIAIIDRGQLVAQGDLRSLLEPGLNVKTNIELTEPLSSQELKDLRLVCPVEQRGQHLICNTKGSSADLAAVFSMLATAGAVVVTVRHGVQNLEELFMRLTNHSLRD
jgi:ABC-2 type transport system ATP-binding protein